MNLSTKTLGNVLLMRISGAIDMINVAQFKIAYREALKSGIRKVILDFYELKDIHPAGIGATINLFVFLKTDQGELVIIDSPHGVCRLFRGDPQGRQIRVFKNENEAFDYFSLAGSVLTAQDRIRLEIRDIGSIVMLILRGRMDIQNVVAFTNTWKNILLKGTRKIILNFLELEFIDSSGIGAMTVLRNKIAGLNGKLAVIGKEEPLIRLIAMTGLKSYFTFAANEQEALDLFREPPVV